MLVLFLFFLVGGCFFLCHFLIKQTTDAAKDTVLGAAGEFGDTVTEALDKVLEPKTRPKSSQYKVVQQDVPFGII